MTQAPPVQKPQNQPVQLSAKLTQMARMPMYRGAIFQMEADDKGLALVDAKVQSLKVYLMIDPEADQVVEVRFFTYGGPIFTALADTLCRKFMGAKVEDFTAIKAESLEQELRDEPSVPSMPLDAPELGHVNSLIALLHSQYPEKKAIAMAARKAMESAKLRAGSVVGRTEADSEWLAHDIPTRKALIEEALTKHVRQALNMDGGDIEVLDIVDDARVKVRYQGACSSCGSSIGGTLIYIENQLREHVYYNLTVEPDTAGLF